MKAVSTHSIEHIRVHLAYEAMKTKLLTSIKSLSKKISRVTEKIATTAVVILVGGLFVTAIMKIGEYGVMTSYYCDLITKMIFMP